MSLITVHGQDEMVANFVGGQIRNSVPPTTGFTAIGVAETIEGTNDAVLIAGFVYVEYRRPIDDWPGDIQAWVAVDEAHRGKWLNRTILRKVFSYPFNQLGCSRINTSIAKNNKASRKLCLALGFVEEGKQRQAYPNNVDGILYGMLKSECKWIG